MANRYLIASGDSENPAIYDGGTLPAVDDVLRLNAFVWTVSANRTLAELRTDAMAPAVATTAARSVIINNGVTLTCTTRVLGISDLGLFGTVPGATATVISALFTNAMARTLNGTERINFIGNLETTSLATNGRAIYGPGTVNWTGNINNASQYIFDTELNGTLNITGNVSQGAAGMWVKAPGGKVTVNGSIQNAGSPFYDTTATTFQPFVHNGPCIAGSAPVIRSRSPYHGTGPFINNGEIMALECSRVRLLGTDNQWSMIKADGSAQTLRTAGLLTGYPAENKVEDGTVYGPSNEFEGTMEPWDAAFAQALATAQRDLQLPSILSSITAP